MVLVSTGSFHLYEHWGGDFYLLFFTPQPFLCYLGLELLHKLGRGYVQWQVHRQFPAAHPEASGYIQLTGTDVSVLAC